MIKINLLSRGSTMNKLTLLLSFASLFFHSFLAAKSETAQLIEDTTQDIIRTKKLLARYQEPLVHSRLVTIHALGSDGAIQERGLLPTNISMLQESTIKGPLLKVLSAIPFGDIAQHISDCKKALNALSAYRKQIDALAEEGKEEITAETCIDADNADEYETNFDQEPATVEAVSTETKSIDAEIEKTLSTIVDEDETTVLDVAEEKQAAVPAKTTTVVTTDEEDEATVLDMEESANPATPAPSTMPSETKPATSITITTTPAPSASTIAASAPVLPEEPKAPIATSIAPAILPMPIETFSIPPLPAEPAAPTLPAEPKKPVTASSPATTADQSGVPPLPHDIPAEK